MSTITLPDTFKLNEDNARAVLLMLSTEPLDAETLALLLTVKDDLTSWLKRFDA